MHSAWLTPREASDYARVNPITLKRAVKAGTLQAFRVNGGRLLRYRREDLDAWLSLAPVVKEAR
jgi:excisionase family DNA binding protein